MKFCGNCGNELKNEVRFCPKCGAEQQKNHTEEQAVVDKEPNQQSLPKVKKKAFNPSVLAIIAVLIVVVGGVVFWQRENIFGSSVSKATTARQALKVEQKVFPFRNGNRMGLTNDKFEIIRDDVGSSLSKFNKKGVAVAYDWEGSSSAYLINEQGEQISSEFYSIGTFQMQHALLGTTELQSENGVMDFQDEEFNTGLIDSNGEIVKEASPITISPFYGGKLAVFYNNSRDKSGVISDSGEIVVEPIYDQITIIDDNQFVVKRQYEDSSYKVINKKGDELRDPITGDYFYALESGDYVLESLNGKYSILDQKLNVLLENLFSSTPTSSADGKYFLAYDEYADGYMLYDRSGEQLLSNYYSSLGFPNAAGNMTYMMNREYGLINLNEEYIYQDYIANDGGYGSFNQIPDTDVYVLGTSEGVAYLDSEGNSLIDEWGIPSQETYVDGYIPVYRNDASFDEGMTLLSLDGQLLSDSAIFAFNTGETIVIQENDQYMRIFSTKDYSEKDGEWLDFEPLPEENFTDDSTFW
ncbi:zinc-ribbon domain-containing protein [Enterococcus olivae]